LLREKTIMPVTISIIGYSGSGKTILVAKLVSELKRRKYKIGTIKHASHGFNMDKKGKDSWLHREAGADAVMVATSGKIVIIKDEPRDRLDHLESYFHDMDLIITEGFKHEDRPKIEVYREAGKSEPILPNQELVAFVTDSDIDPGVQKFGLEDIPQLADFIESTFLSTRAI